MDMSFLLKEICPWNSKWSENDYWNSVMTHNFKRSSNIDNDVSKTHVLVKKFEYETISFGSENTKCIWK